MDVKKTILPGEYEFSLAPGGRVLSHVEYRPGPWFRLRGLLGRRALASGTGIWLLPCDSIHMFFMQFPIDAIFLDRNQRIVHVVHHIGPWSLVWPVRGAYSCLEIPAGEAVGLAPGMELQVRQVPACDRVSSKV
ncbi:MAG: DUF192 domain-containing protein [Candidatus Methylacidiphilales bacterium]|nr:DUF192 domain-containing protein [Candidatus Methylacidiphilales bacterium]